MWQLITRTTRALNQKVKFAGMLIETKRTGKQIKLITQNNRNVQNAVSLKHGFSLVAKAKAKVKAHSEKTQQDTGAVCFSALRTNAADAAQEEARLIVCCISVVIFLKSFVDVGRFR